MISAIFDDRIRLTLAAWRRATGAAAPQKAIDPSPTR
jgi:hypothetical protein